MKKLISLTSMILLLVALIPASCKKDKEKSNEELLLGYWDVTKVKLVEYLNGTYNDTYTDTYTEGELGIEFLNDGTYNMYTDGDLTSSYDWEMNGDNLIMDGDDTDYTVTESKLTLIAEFEYDSNGDTYREVVTITATK
jgi:hypothetical protein